MFEFLIFGAGSSLMKGNFEVVSELGKLSGIV